MLPFLDLPQIHFSNMHNPLLAALPGKNWQSAWGSHQPCLPVLWKKGFPSLARQQQSCGIEAAFFHSETRIQTITNQKTLATCTTRNEIICSHKAIFPLRLEQLDNIKTLCLTLTFILNPAFALVSINITPNSRALPSPSSIETCLFDHRKTKTNNNSAELFQATYRRQLTERTINSKF